MDVVHKHQITLKIRKSRNKKCPKEAVRRTLVPENTISSDMIELERDCRRQNRFLFEAVKIEIVHNIFKISCKSKAK